MDRSIAYTQEQGRSTDFLFAQRSTMIGLSKLAKAVLGSNTVIEGLAVTPNSPAALNAIVGTGQIYSVQNVDSSAYGILAADTVHTILKQGLLMDAVTLATAAPTTVGYSINYLIQATFQESDTTTAVLPYFNSANPSQPLSGQNNSGAAQATERQDLCIVAVKAGAAATTGTQTTPAPDAGYTGLAVVTVANGQTTVTAANIAVYAGVPQISSILQMMQSGSTIYAADTGAANAYAVALTPAPVLTDGMMVAFRALNANTGASTLNINSLGAKALVNQDGTVLAANTITAGAYVVGIYSAPANNIRLTQGLTQSLADARYAALAGLVTQAFSAAALTLPSSAYVNSTAAQTNMGCPGSLLNVTNVAGNVQANVAVANAIGPTHAVALGQFIASLGATYAPGYIEIPTATGTLIIQWILGTSLTLAAGIGTTQVVTFPIAFPNACTAAYITGASTAAVCSLIHCVGSVSTTSVTDYIFNSSTASTTGTPWLIAVGH